MRKRIFAMIIAMLMLLSIVPSAMAEGSDTVEIYVSISGSDSAAGTKDAPLKSLTAARDKIRSLKESGIAPAGGFVVYLRGGDYQQTECLELDSRDSGTKEAPVVFRAYPGEKVTLVGGASIPGSSFKKVTDKEVLERIIDENARAKVMVADLGALGFTEFGEPFWPGAYSYMASWLTEPSAASPELFIDGKVQTLARYPNEGYMKVKEVFHAGAAPRYWEPDMAGDARYKPEGQRDPEDTFEISFDDNRFLKWTKVSPRTAIMSGYFWYDWADHSVPIEKVEGGKIYSSEPSWYGVRTGQRLFVMNLIEEIDIPGEYYLDRENALLYVYPEKDLADSDIKFSLLENDLVHVDGAEHITFKDLKMTAMRSSAVVINTGNNIEIRDCEIEYTADYAVVMEPATRECRVIDSYLHDVNGGVYMRSGDYPTLTEGNSKVVNNVITRFSRINKTYTPAVQLQGVGNHIQHNEMYDAPHCAIQYAGNEHDISYNEIYNVCQQADDMGAIYSGRSWVQRGTKIHYNHIHDVRTDSKATLGLFMIYFDDRLSQQSVVGNLIRNCDGHAFFSNGGRDHVYYNNIVINQEKCYKIGALIPPDPMAIDPVNLMNSLKTVPWQNEQWTKKYPLLSTILDIEGDATYPNNNYAGNNLLVNCAPRIVDSEYIHPEAYARGTFDKDYEVASIEFVDEENGIYLLPEDSPVFKELPDFKNLPVTRMGTYSHRAEARVNEAVTMAVGSPNVIKKGENTFIDAENTSVVPVIKDSRTFVPLRFISEAFGMDVQFNNETREITISGNGIVLSLFPGEASINKNGVATQIDAPAYISGEGRTMVPLRAISEMLDKKVYWNNRGLIIISDTENIINDKADDNLVDYLYSELINY